MVVPAPSQPRKTVVSRGGAGDVLCELQHLKENIIQVKAALASLAESFGSRHSLKSRPLLLGRQARFETLISIRISAEHLHLFMCHSCDMEFPSTDGNICKSLILCVFFCNASHRDLGTKRPAEAGLSG